MRDMEEEDEDETKTKTKKKKRKKSLIETPISRDKQVGMFLGTAGVHEGINQLHDIPLLKHLP